MLCEQLMQYFGPGAQESLQSRETQWLCNQRLFQWYRREAFGHQDGGG